jgi:hypothetical protein
LGLLKVVDKNNALPKQVFTYICSALKKEEETNTKIYCGVEPPQADRWAHIRLRRTSVRVLKVLIERMKF